MEDKDSLRPKNNPLSIEVTTHCNSACSHCFVRARGSLRSSLDTHLVQAFVREGYELGYRHLHLTGGEPLLWEGLYEIFDYAFGLGYLTAFLNTNGTLLTGKVSRKLSSYHGLTISISLQGPKRFHDRIRGKGSFDKALKGIDLAMDAGLPVHVFTPVGRSLLPELPRFSEDLFVTFPGIKQLTLIQLIRVPEDVFDLSREVLSPGDFLRLVRIISLLNIFGFKTLLLNNPLAAVASRILGLPWVIRSPPLHRPGSVMLTVEGHLTLAHSTTEHFGTYEPGNLSAIINSDNYCRAVSEEQLICQRCEYISLCRIEEMMRPSEWSRDMFPQIPYCRRVLAQASSYG